MREVCHVAFGLMSTAFVAWLVLRRPAHPAAWARLRHDGPVIITYLVGAWVVLPLGLLWAGAYLAMVLAASCWFIFHLCPYCEHVGRGDGPSMYCAVANRITKKADSSLFRRQFRRHVPVIALAWLAPPVGGGILLVRNWGDWTQWSLTCFSLAVFGLIAFYLLPRGARSNCGTCKNRTCARNCRAATARPADISRPANVDPAGRS